MNEHPGLLGCQPPEAPSDILPIVFGEEVGRVVAEV
jgi:hypothetical protein